MKALHYAKLFVLVVIALGFTACQSEEELEHLMIGQSWVGDLGMTADNGEELYSELVFDGDGFGVEYQYYKYDDAYYDEFRFQWNWEDKYSSNLVLDYGRNGISFFDDVQIYSGRMSGVFYFEDGAPGMNVILRAQ